MDSYYDVEVEVGKQEDGLWRLSVPGLQGAWVDAMSLEEGFTEIQEVIALALDYYQEHGRDLPDSVRRREGQPAKARLPIVVSEYQLSPRPPARTRPSR